MFQPIFMYIVKNEYIKEKECLINMVFCVVVIFMFLLWVILHTPETYRRNDR